MSIIVLTPKPNNASLAATDSSISTPLVSDFLHLLGQDGHRFESFEQLRDFAQAQIDAANVAAKAAEVAATEPVAEPALPVADSSQLPADASAAVTGAAPQV